MFAFTKLRRRKKRTNNESQQEKNNGNQQRGVGRDKDSGRRFA